MTVIRVERMPTLETERLTLRPFTPEDATAVYQLVKEWDVASTTLNIPHPYEPAMADSWIRSHTISAAAGDGFTLALIERAGGALIGSIALRLSPPHDRGELGYWVGRPYWGQGYITEAARAVMKHGFEVLNLNRIEAHHLTRNPASGRVMQKLGMTWEGRAREHVKKWDEYEDVEAYSILRREYHG
jgi:[ribosomal protein S5]-alanine N-acetyltransferase